MSKYAVMPLEDYKNACDKIREECMESETIKSGELSQKIERVYETGHKNGYQVGEIDGYDTGILEGEKNGKKAANDAFWDIIQNFGNRTDYAHAFAYQAWSDETFKPKYDIRIVGSGANLFRASSNTITDLEAALERAGVVLDTSGATNLNNAFANSNLTLLPTIDMTECTSNGTGALSIQPNTITIRKIISSEGTYWSSAGTFRYATGLVNLIVEGVIGRGGFDVQWSKKLSKDSITSIINALSTTTSGLSVAFSKTAVNKAFETSTEANNGMNSTEWTDLKATKSNWTINLV